MARILVIDDEKAIRQALSEIFEYEEHEVKEAEDGISALKILETDSFDAIFCDIKMPGMDGVEILEKLRNSETAPFIMISGHGNIETAVECLKKGAFDYIQKPLDLQRVLVSLRNALERKELVQETIRLKKHLQSNSDIIGKSKILIEMLEMTDRVAPSDARVLILGDNGTGKELVARRIHEKSMRTHAPFIEVNCAAIPGELIESELFGHEKGAFTSAIKQRKGSFEQADGGTLFLDEIGDMSLSAQAKVLRVLQENKITRVGGDKSISVNVRLIAATNKNLQEEIAQGRFREDLFHRIGVIIVKVPKLSERREDIPLLIDYFIKQICRQNGKAALIINEEAIDYLQNYPWSGNIRELRNIMERLIILCDGSINLTDIKKYVI